MLVSFNNLTPNQNFKSYDVFHFLEMRSFPEVQLLLREAYQNTQRIPRQNAVIEKANKFGVPVVNLSIPLSDKEKAKLAVIKARKLPEPRYYLDYRPY